MTPSDRLMPSRDPCHPGCGNVGYRSGRRRWTDITMLTRETERKLSLLARQVWAGRRSDKALQQRLLSDPALFLQENGIMIPDDFETGASVGEGSVSFRFRPRKVAV